GLLPALVLRGHHVDAFDLSPAAVALTSLRRPAYLALRAPILARLDTILKRCPLSPTHRPGRFDESWIADDTADWLRHYAHLVERSANTTSDSELDLSNSMAALRYLPLLISREITAYTASDNAAWLKAGGLRRAVDLKVALKTAAMSWSEYL